MPTVTSRKPPLFKAVPVDELTEHPDNPRQGDIGAIMQSIEANGWFGGITVQRSTGRILDGNHRYRAACLLDFKTIPVAWADVDDDTALRILLAANRTSDLAIYDDPVLVEVLTRIAENNTLVGTGYDGDDLDALIAALNEPLDFSENPYVSKIIPPVYEITGDKPNPNELLDNEYADTLRAEITAADLTPTDREFLLAAADRHTVFKFDRIAEFYAHSDATVQHLMERSGLVIIDYDKAVENGFVQMSEILAGLVETANDES